MKGFKLQIKRAIRTLRQKTQDILSAISHFNSILDFLTRCNSVFRFSWNPAYKVLRPVIRWMFSWIIALISAFIDVN